MGSSINFMASGLETVDHLASTQAKVIVNNDLLFTVVGDIQIISLFSECYTTNDATASTLQYKVVNGGNTTTISGVSASMANAATLETFILNGAALTDAPIKTSNSGVGLNTTARGIRVPNASTIRVNIGVGSTTGTWKHYIKYEPLEYGAFAF